MTKHMLSVVAVMLATSLLCGLAGAAPFGELFQITKVTGECQVQTAGAEAFVNAVDGNAYQYGTKIKTGRKSSAVIVFSEGNECRVLANASLTITKDVKDEKLKSVNLDTGKVEIILDAEYEKSGDKLNVVTPTAICGAIGCKFSVDSRIEEDLLVVVTICEDGKIEMSGHGFKVPMDAEDGLTISAAKDRSFIRVKNIKGSFQLHCRDAEGNPKVVEMKVGSVVKIWRSKSATGNAWVVTILITSPDGALEEAITYNEAVSGEAAGGGEAGGGEAAGGEGVQGGAGEEGVAGEELGGDEVITTTTTTTSTTTTTTINQNSLEENEEQAAPVVITTGGGQGGGGSPTPVGRR